MLRYARALENGEGVEQDIVQAMDYVQQTAKAGNIDAMVRFAVALREGTAVVRDPDLAIASMRQAAAAGHPRAAAHLNDWARVSAIPKQRRINGWAPWVAGAVIVTLCALLFAFRRH
jgi:TPR repeat protein